MAQAKPTKRDVTAQIKALREIMPKVVHFNFFGDDNHAAIEAQIEVLRSEMHDDEIDAQGWKESVASAARDARLWLDGDRDDDNMDLVSEWKEIAK